MSYPVYYPVAGDTLPIFFSTFDGGTGASITMSGLAVTDIEIYKDGSTTQRASDAGYTLLDTDGIDFDGITGIHGFSIDLSDNTDSGFYEVGPWYHVIVSSVTVDGQTVNFPAAAFRIVSATRGMAGTALPDAAADAAGGLPISDAGGLDLDGLNTNVAAILADTGTDGVVVASGSKSGYTISGTLTTLDALDTAQDSQHSTTQSAITALRGTISTLDAFLEKVRRYFALALRKDTAIATDAATELGEINVNISSGGGAYDQTTDSQEATRDHVGDGTNLTEAGGTGDHLTALSVDLKAGALDAAALATDAVEEIRDAITGGAYALDTDANGRVRLVVGTGTGEITLSGGIASADVKKINNVTVQGAGTSGNEWGPV